MFLHQYHYFNESIDYLLIIFCYIYYLLIIIIIIIIFLVEEMSSSRMTLGQERGDHPSVTYECLSPAKENPNQNKSRDTCCSQCRFNSMHIKFIYLCLLVITCSIFALFHWFKIRLEATNQEPGESKIHNHPLDWSTKDDATPPLENVEVSEEWVWLEVSTPSYDIMKVQDGEDTIMTTTTMKKDGNLSSDWSDGIVPPLRRVKRHTRRSSLELKTRNHGDSRNRRDAELEGEHEIEAKDEAEATEDNGEELKRSKVTRSRGHRKGNESHPDQQRQRHRQGKKQRKQSGSEVSVEDEDAYGGDDNDDDDNDAEGIWLTSYFRVPVGGLIGNCFQYRDG